MLHPCRTYMYKYTYTYTRRARENVVIFTAKRLPPREVDGFTAISDPRPAYIIYNNNTQTAVSLFRRDTEHISLKSTQSLELGGGGGGGKYRFLTTRNSEHEKRITAVTILCPLCLEIPRRTLR